MSKPLVSKVTPPSWIAAELRPCRKVVVDAEERRVEPSRTRARVAAAATPVIEPVVTVTAPRLTFAVWPVPATCPREMLAKEAEPPETLSVPVPRVATTRAPLEAKEPPWMSSVPTAAAEASPTQTPPLPRLTVPEVSVKVPVPTSPTIRLLVPVSERLPPSTT